MSNYFWASAYISKCGNALDVSGTGLSAEVLEGLVLFILIIYNFKLFYVRLLERSNKHGEERGERKRIIATPSNYHFPSVLRSSRIAFCSICSPLAMAYVRGSSRTITKPIPFLKMVSFSTIWNFSRLRGERIKLVLIKS